MEFQNILKHLAISLFRFDSPKILIPKSWQP